MQPTTGQTPAQRADETTRLESLAQETDTALNLVKTIYTEELHALESQARIRTFLSVIAMRRTRMILQHLDSSAEQLEVH